MKRILSLLVLITLCVVEQKAQDGGPVELCAVVPAPGYYDALPTEWVVTYGGKTLTVDEEAEVRLTCGETEYPLSIMLDENDGTRAVISFDGNPIATPGEWLVEIPGNTISIEGVPIADPQSFKYIVNNTNDYSISPAEGTVESLSTFIITFNNYMIELNEEETGGVLLINTETDEEVKATVTEIAGKKLYVELDSEVTKAGSYQLIIADATVKNLATDTFLGEFAFNYTINGESNGIITIADRIKDGNVVCNLNGQKVAKAKKGLYIINGKKRVVR